MAVRYTPEELKHLRNSPLIVKPPGLPPAEQWMGPAAEGGRNQAKPIADRGKNHDSAMLLDQTNRRPGVERHMSRNSANPEDIILGPPKTSFMSATSLRNKPVDASDRPGFREADSRDRYPFRGKPGEGESDRTREGRPNTLRPKRIDGEQDSEGWSTVKPRKSFGTEGAERFNGRMGVDRHRDDRRFKDREDREVKERQPRGFDTFSRDKEREQDQEGDSRRNGNGRARNEPSWFRDSNNGPPTPRDRNSNGDRFADRTRGWREKDRDERGGERGGDRVVERAGNNRWDRDRDQRQERDPEWMDEPADEKAQAHTQEDFQKWKEQMQGKDQTKAGDSRMPAEEAPAIDTSGQGSFFGLEKAKVETPLPIDTGPDKFFGMWAAPKEDAGPDSTAESRKEGPTKTKTVGKASRFTSFFTPQEEPQRRQTEPPPAMSAAPPNGFDSLFSNTTQSSSEKEAFQQLLQKLQRQSAAGSGTTPPANPSQQPKPPAPEKHPGNPIPAPESLQQYRPEHQEDGQPSARNSQQALQDLLTQRQVAGSQPSVSVRPEQMLQELVGQRQMALSQSSIRPDQSQSRNSNTEFLMGLMQSAKAAPEPQRTEQLLLRMPPQKQLDRQMHQQQLQMNEREQEIQREALQRERGSSQRQTRQQPPPGFFDEQSFQRGPPPQHDGNNGPPPRPTQILQRPPPPGLDQIPPAWAQPPTQLPPPQQRHIAPPPGLAGGLSRGMPMPQQMFPPGFPMGNFPPPDAMIGPPRNMQPPPGFFNGPPPGFLPPGMSGFQGPEGMAFGGPFDGRGPPPQGFRRQ